MGKCGSSIKEFWLEDERNSSETYDSDIAHNTSGDPVKSCESVCMSKKSVDSLITSVKNVSENAIEESREGKKESGDLPHITLVGPQPKYYAELGGSPGHSFDKNLLSSTFRAGYTTKSEADVRFSRFPSNTHQTSISDWGDAYEGTAFLNTNGSLPFPSFVSGSFSDQVTSGDSSATSFELKNLTILPGHVLGMLWANKGFQFEMLNLNWSIEEVVDLLVKKCGARLPVSFSKNKRYLPKLLSNERMQMTIAENLGSQFDVKTKGLIFATGSVNSKFCYKITECERSEMEKMLSVFRSDHTLRGSSNANKD